MPSCSRSVRLRRRDAVLCLFAAIAAGPAMACGVPAGGFPANASDTWQRSYTLEPAGELRVANGNGNGSVEVDGVDGSTVAIRAERVAAGATEEVAHDILPRITIDAEATPRLVSVQTERIRGLLIGVRYRVNYHITAPRSAAIRANNVNGLVSIAGVEGRVTAQTVNGTIHVEGARSGVDARTVNGILDVQLASVGGDESVALTTTNGSVTLAVPAAARATVTATWGNGTIETSGLPFEVSERSRRRFEGRLNGGGRPIDIRTANGRITVKPADSGQSPAPAGSTRP